MAHGGKDPPKGAKRLSESWASLPERNRRWRKSHQNKNLTAPRSSEREDCENDSSADRGSAERQVIIGLQMGDSSVYMLWLPSYRALRRAVGKRIALLSACCEQRFSFLKSRPFVSVPGHGRLTPSKKQRSFSPIVRRIRRIDLND